jgi:protein-S-isoprenylcysteine O-methyltransferase Ste14
MYTAFFVIGFGFLLLSANWFISAIYLGTLTLMYATRVSIEEKMMLERFGDEYHQYMTKTGRLLPRFKK